MPKICYEKRNFRKSSMAMINAANSIIEKYRAMGYNLTLRQLYYQFVSMDLIPNQQSEYKRLGSVVSDARRAGLIDWDAITDRTRMLRGLNTWDAPADVIRASAQQFRYDLWLEQDSYVEVWFEKDAVMGVFERAANAKRVNFFSCRGYTSDSEIWAAAQRLRSIEIGNKYLFPAGIKPRGRNVIVLHFGDHDPSGIDMTRDIAARLKMFGVRTLDMRRLALTMEQIEEYNPPPNPAKDTDSRFTSYQTKYGDESWELDALEPTVLGDLVANEVDSLIDQDAWNKSVRRENRGKKELKLLSDNYALSVRLLQDNLRKPR